MATMGKLTEEGMKAGWLIATEGVHFGATGVRVHKSPGGKVTVTEGPFAETKEVIGGYALLKAATRDEVVELTGRFLNMSPAARSCFSNGLVRKRRRKILDCLGLPSRPPPVAPARRNRHLEIAEL